MSPKQAISCSCSKCGKSFTEPIELTVQAEGSHETYHACPHCFSKVSLEDRKMERKEIPPSASKKRRKEKASSIEKNKPAGCAHFLGYLKTRPKGSPIPEECLTCVSVMQCMGLSRQP